MALEEFGTVRQVILERLKVGSNVALSPYMAASAEVDVHQMAVDRLVANLRSYVLAEHLVEQDYTARLEVPASWWDHFKRDSRLWRRLPRWLTGRWPVRYAHMTRTVTFNRYNAYPEASILPQDRFGAPVVWETWEPGGWHAV